MINFNKYKQVGTIVCDECDRQEDFDAADFAEFMVYARSRGWVNKKIDETWFNYCEDCVARRAK